MTGKLKLDRYEKKKKIMKKRKCKFFKNGAGYCKKQNRCKFGHYLNNGQEYLYPEQEVQEIDLDFSNYESDSFVRYYENEQEEPIMFSIREM